MSHTVWVRLPESKYVKRKCQRRQTPNKQITKKSQLYRTLGNWHKNIQCEQKTSFSEIWAPVQVTDTSQPSVLTSGIMEAAHNSSCSLGMWFDFFPLREILSAVENIMSGHFSDHFLQELTPGSFPWLSRTSEWADLKEFLRPCLPVSHLQLLQQTNFSVKVGWCFSQASHTATRNDLDQAVS